MSEPSDKRKVILVATDFSEPARKAADAAAALASANGASLMLVHAHHALAIPDLPELPQLAAQAAEAAETALEREAERLSKTGTDVRSEFLEGPPGHRVLEAAKSCRADLIVLGSERRKVIERWLLGDVAEYVAEHTEIPTLIVREPKPLVNWVTKLERLGILVGQNLREPSDNSLLWVKSLVEIAPVRVTVAYVTWPYDEAHRYGFPPPPTYFDSSPELMELISRDLTRRVERLTGDIGAETVVKASWVGADIALAQLAKESQTDLIVLGKHQHRALSRFLEHSVSRSTMHDTPANLAIIPCSAEPASPAPITRFERVLVATDFTPESNRAIPMAYSMVGEGGVVCLAHVCRRNGITPHDAESRLLTLIPEEARSMGIRSEVMVTVNQRASSGLLQLATRFGADAVCLSCHTRSEFSEALFSSPSRELLRAIRIPILMVHASTN
jgi:nucleotide-binding universal stress UspA family protein